MVGEVLRSRRGEFVAPQCTETTNSLQFIPPISTTCVGRDWLLSLQCRVELGWISFLVMTSLMQQAAAIFFLPGGIADLKRGTLGAFPTFDHGSKNRGQYMATLWGH